MTVLTFLIPISLFLGLLGLVGFLWLLKNDQFEDPEGEAHRILSDRYDRTPAPPPVAEPARDESVPPKTDRPLSGSERQRGGAR